METNSAYPYHPVPEGSAIPYTADPGACVRCGRCRTVCPVNTIAMTELSAVIQSQCIGCGSCQAVCPAGAIHPNRR